MSMELNAVDTFVFVNNVTSLLMGSDLEYEYGEAN